MSCPPLGQPWMANVGSNPNINREAPPPPIGGAPPPQVPLPATGPAAGGQVSVEQQQGPIYGDPVPIGVGGMPFGMAPAIGLGAFPPMGLGMMDPLMMGGYGVGGSLAPIQAGKFLPGAYHGIGFGLHATDGMPFPPPPPGAIAGVVPPFAPAAPLWAPGGGLAFGNVPAMGGGIMPPMMGGMIGMGMGLGMGGASMHGRPGPMFIDGNLGFPEQPKQNDPTVIAGGVPRGVTLIESAEHTIVLHIKGNMCPWLSPGAQFQVEALALGSSTGLNRVIQVLNNNASAEDCQNMAMTECIELGNGFWEKGMTFKYDEATSKVLTLGCVGWDNKRNRTGGQSLHLWGHRI